MVGGEELRPMRWALLGWPGPRHGADDLLCDPGWPGEVGREPTGQALLGELHDGVPDRRRPRHPAGVPHRCVVGIADPYANGDVGCESEGPVVAIVVGRAGLGRGREGEVEQRVRTEGRCAGGVVGEDRRDQEGVLGTDDLIPRRRLILIHRLPGVIDDPGDGHRRNAQAAVGEYGVGAGELEQRDISSAQGE